jgi:ABC-2 type transport system permease protein
MDTRTANLNLSSAQIATLNQQIQFFFSSPLRSVLPLLERMIAIGLQVVFSMLIWKAFVSRSPIYAILAIAYHAGVDAGLVYLAGTIQNAWLIEGLLVLMFLPGGIWLARIFPRPEKTSSPLRQEWKIFSLALHKELTEQWRSRKAIVVVAVFGAFGMMSPLLAYFTPQMLMLLPGAEMFAELIPTPSTADALAQYIKNISQFGFILAILIGMGAVAGEKERGTASLILSKPMTRSAFVLSKFTAQALTFLAGFIIATLGAFFYTWVLFGDLKPVIFILISFLLYIWFLPYAAITLDGSVIARNTGAAAGIGLLGAVILLVSSSLPWVGQFMPGALVGWAGQMALSAAAQLSPSAPVNFTSNAGALVVCVVLTVIGLISAIAIFEQQEP